MFMRFVMVTIAVTLFYLPASASGSGASATPAAAKESPAAAVPPAAGEDVATLRQTLKEKREELAKLHHKWVVSKGRNPTEKEIQAFEKKRLAGKATYKDNPYVNKNPLQTPFAAREAYYNKLEEVRQIEERLKSSEGSSAANGG